MCVRAGRGVEALCELLLGLAEHAAPPPPRSSPSCSSAPAMHLPCMTLKPRIWSPACRSRYRTTGARSCSSSMLRANAATPARLRCSTSCTICAQSEDPNPGFPVQRFRGQEPGTDDEIFKFATRRGAKFDLFRKVEVK